MVSINTSVQYNIIPAGTETKEVNLREIDVLFTTEQIEEKRTTFNETFEETNIIDAKQGQRFVSGLINEQDALMQELGLTEEEYISYSCVALALASQETGMGYENGYVKENTGMDAVARFFGKMFDCHVCGNGSASSGLTQMKIYDFLNSKNSPLTKEHKQILKDHGVSSLTAGTSNLYDEPEKAAVATIVVLTALADTYDNYLNILNRSHSELENTLSNDGLNEEERLAKGEEAINKVLNAYKTADDQTKVEIRKAFKEWVLSKNGTTKESKYDKEYNEEIQLEELNAFLGENTLSQSDLNYIRYYLTSEDQEMNMTEYLAYSWNNGTGETAQQLDRLLASKIGTIFANPEEFNYDQFVVNVENLTNKYVQILLED